MNSGTVLPDLVCIQSLSVIWLSLPSRVSSSISLWNSTDNMCDGDKETVDGEQSFGPVPKKFPQVARDLEGGKTINKEVLLGMGFSTQVCGIDLIPEQKITQGYVVP